MIVQRFLSSTLWALARAMRESARRVARLGLRMHFRADGIVLRALAFDEKTDGEDRVRLSAEIVSMRLERAARQGRDRANG